MSDDITGELRAYAASSDNYRANWLCDDAADTIDALRAERDALQAKLDEVEDRTSRHAGDGGWPWSWHDETLKPDDPMIAYWLGADRMLRFIRTGSPHPEGDTHD